MKPQLSLFATTLLSRASNSITYAQSSDHINFDVYGTILQIPAASEIEYDQNQNGGGSAPTFPDDQTLRVIGNRWSAYPLATEIYEDSVLQFSFTLNEKTNKGFQAICLDADVEITGSNGQCFVLSSTQGWIDNMLNVNKMTNVNTTTHHSIPIGHFLTGHVNYLAFLQDSDGTSAEKLLGDSSIQGLRLVQQSRIGLRMNVGGDEVELENHQFSYKYKSGNQDTSDWLMHISEDGDSVQGMPSNFEILSLIYICICTTLFFYFEHSSACHNSQRQSMESFSPKSTIYYDSCHHSRIRHCS